MLLKDYFPNLDKKYHKLSFKGIAFNSKEVKKGYIFFALKGSNTDGNSFIKDAIQNGSKIIISDPFLIASFIKKFPSVLFPLKAKKMYHFLNSLDLKAIPVILNS